MERYCNNSWSRIVQLLGSDAEKGISEEKSRVLRKKYGNNKIDLSTKKKIYEHIFNSLKNKSILMFIAIVATLFIMNNYILGSVAAIILLINIILLVVHYVKRDSEINNFQKVIYTDTVVIRDGIQKSISSEELVVGDVVLLYKDCIVPADIRIINSENLKVNEKNITGEKNLKSKICDIIIGAIDDPKQMKNILFKGSTICSGEALGIVIATGANTQIGRILTMLMHSSNRKHSYGKMVCNSMEKYLGICVGIMALFLLYFLYSGQLIFKEYVELGLFILGCCPFFVVTMLGDICVRKKFLQDKIKIINFSVFNLINNINILFLDKVGSISKKEMIVKKLYFNEELISTDDPYVKEVTFDRMIEIALICNNGVYDTVKDVGIGEMDEIAFLKYAARKKIYKSSIDNKNKRIFDLPKENDKRFSTIVCKLVRGCRANSRGNVDAVLEQCTHIMINGVERELTEEYIDKIKKIDMNLSFQGLITEGFAYRNFNYEPSKDENIESNMVFVGIAALENPLEDDLKESLNKIKDQGIIPIIFTEEGKLSAIANLKKAGVIKNSNQVVAGIEMDSLTHRELKELLCTVRVFCRVTPDIKSKIISLFVKDGYNVAATGEKLGDMPGINLSDVGISKDKASSVVQKVSDVFVEENYLDGFFKIKNFSKIIDKNINKTLRMYFMLILSELLVVVINAIIGQKDTLDMWSILVMNCFMFIPLSQVLILKDGRKMGKREMVVRALMLSALSCISMYKIQGKETGIIPLIIISIGTILYALLSSKISIRKFSNELLRCLICLLVVLVAVAVIVVANNIELRDIVIVEIIISSIFLLVFEILYGKWQDSLMR
ncbi:MAG: cation-transporting P-type ATPase [Clostridium butyricum]|nr:cation-transporting P-type ATPase [Clostridium butyricum]